MKRSAPERHPLSAKKTFIKDFEESYDKKRFGTALDQWNHEKETQSDVWKQYNDAYKKRKTECENAYRAWERRTKKKSPLKRDYVPVTIVRPQSAFKVFADNEVLDPKYPSLDVYWKAIKASKTELYTKYKKLHASLKKEYAAKVDEYFKNNPDALKEYEDDVKNYKDNESVAPDVPAEPAVVVAPPPEPPQPPVPDEPRLGPIVGQFVVTVHKPIDGESIFWGKLSDGTKLRFQPAETTEVNDMVNFEDLDVEPSIFDSILSGFTGS